MIYAKGFDANFANGCEFIKCECLIGLWSALILIFSPDPG